MTSLANLPMTSLANLPPTSKSPHKIGISQVWPVCGQPGCAAQATGDGSAYRKIGALSRSGGCVFSFFRGPGRTPASPLGLAVSLPCAETPLSFGCQSEPEPVLSSFLLDSGGWLS